jgi:hypothetical protein
MPYADPYLTGVLLGLVLLASFYLVGRGLGASGAFAAVAATAIDAASPATVVANRYFAERLPEGGPWNDWLVVQLLGVAIGGYLSARAAGRVSVSVERGDGVSMRRRLTSAAAGGVAMGGGAVLARGCTSGQALTGGALLSVGSWLFVAGAFGAAYLVAFATRRSWR